MMHDITEEHYKQQLHIREKKLEKDREFEMIFRTYVVAVRDIILNFVNLPDKNSQIEKQRTVLLELEKEWNKINPEHKTYNLHKRRGIKFILILLVDLIILYSLQIFFGYDSL
jgi:hypothetical protein